MANLTGFRVAVLFSDGFEEVELTEPVCALKDVGARVTLLSDKEGDVQAFRHLDKGMTIASQGLISDAHPEDFDGVLLPGGAINADTLRALPEVCSFLKAIQASNKPIAAICHAPWELISAGLVKGRRLTSYHTIADDIKNAGGAWLDQELVEDGNWVTSRQPGDLPAFKKAMIELFARSHAEAHQPA